MSRSQRETLCDLSKMIPAEVRTLTPQVTGEVHPAPGFCRDTSHALTPQVTGEVQGNPSRANRPQRVFLMIMEMMEDNATWVK